MVGIHIDVNYIFCETMKNRTEGVMIKAYQKMVDRMQLTGLGLKHHRLDNECSDNFKKCIRKNNMTHKLVPPDCHSRNMAEQAIQTFKNHFVLILSGVDDRFSVVLPCPTRQTYRQIASPKQRGAQNIDICTCARAA